MVQFNLPFVKDLGLQKQVMDALPYAVVGGAWEASFDAALAGDEYYTALNHIVPTGLQLKVLFLRIWTQESSGARFSVYQTNPSTALTAADVAAGKTEAYPVVGSVPPATLVPPANTAVRDYPMLEAAGAEVLTGSLRDPVHVLEGSIDFRVLSQYPGVAVPGPATASLYGITWWGVQKTPDG